MNILAISGSLRAASLNSALLRTARRVAPAGVDALKTSLAALCAAVTQVGQQG